MPVSEKCPFSPNYKRPTRPAADFFESENDFKLYFDLPGVQKKDIKVDIKDHVLTLSAEVNFSLPKDDEIRFSERSAGGYSRDVPLPSNIAPDKIQAKFENGVLVVTVPKGVPSVKKSITIS
ncbi:HSP20-like chaperone [Backusella circina FSU 941]|nr:HSP20-like chaperone [Backusella circina FSU 941]